MDLATDRNCLKTCLIMRSRSLIKRVKICRIFCLIFLISLFLVSFGSVYGEEWAPEDYGWFVTGGLTGFVVHESAHMLVAESLGIHPRVGSRRKPVPFIVIRYDFFAIKDPSGKINYVDKEGNPVPSGAQKRFAISSAGINSQNISSELILTRYPSLREEPRPFLKGVLAFDIVTSIGYSLIGRLDPDGDLRGMSESKGISNLVIATLVFVPAAIDLYRYYYPKSAWAPWVDRGAKGYLLGLSFWW